MRTDDTTGDPAPSRRGFLRAATAGTAAAALGVGATGTATAQDSNFDGWLDNVGNYDGTVVDQTGQDEVTVEVGAQGNGGGFAFAPPAVRVDPGATVVFEWTGEGGQHNVVGENADFESELTAEAGFTFEQTFEEEGVVKYFCSPHQSLGMKGVVVVGGDGGGGGGGSQATPIPAEYGGWFDGVGNYSGETADRRGQDSVTITVGAEGNGGAFAFDPPAVRISPGTTVTWEWTGEGGQHNVVAQEGGDFESELTSESGFTFEQTFEESGIVTYVCSPHQSLGMKGALIVDPASPGSSGGGGSGGEGGDDGTQLVLSPGLSGFLVAVGLGIVSPIVFAAVLMYRKGKLGGSPAHRREHLERVPPGEEFVTAEAPEAEPETAIEHDEFDPTGTAGMIFVYFLILVALWIFMYFVEFLGNGPTIIG